MDLKSLNIDQLKAKIYDSLVVVENHQQFIKMLNQELASRPNPMAPTPVPEDKTAQAIVNTIINEKDEA